MALLGREVDIAATECQSVGIAYDIAGHYLDIEEKIAHHLLDEIELLRIFFSEIGARGLGEVEEFVDHLQHAIEMPRAKMALEDVTLGFGGFDDYLIFMVHRIGFGHEKNIHAGQLAYLFVRFVASGIFAKVLPRQKLRGIDEYRDDRMVVLLHAFFDKTQMPLMERSHGRDKSDAARKAIAQSFELFGSLHHLHSRPFDIILDTILPKKRRKILDSYEYSELLKKLEQKIDNIKDIIKPEQIQKRIEEISELENSPDFWNDAKKAGEIQKEKNRLQRIVEKYNEAKNAVEENKELFEMASEEDDQETLQMLFDEAPTLEEKVNKIEIETMLSGENDDKNAIVSIHPGAGGTESQDWASILYRMYLRWAERHGFKVEILDYQEGEEAGIKDVSFIVQGENAYGYLKAENGVHRLVRISPFDSNARRHTSFASVMVSPEIDDDINIVIEDKDIRVDTYRASGAGGQHVNKTDSAIRITHIPTGIVVQCQNDRSQHRNREMAMKMLKSRLYELELEKKKAEQEGIEKSDIGWGHQIRSYVLAPYQQVKDNRSGKAYSNVEAILDGDIDKIIEDVLIAEAGKKEEE